MNSFVVSLDPLGMSVCWFATSILMLVTTAVADRRTILLSFAHAHPRSKPVHMWLIGYVVHSMCRLCQWLGCCRGFALNRIR